MIELPYVSEIALHLEKGQSKNTSLSGQEKEGGYNLNKGLKECKTRTI